MNIKPLHLPSIPPRWDGQSLTGFLNDLLEAIYTFAEEVRDSVSRMIINEAIFYTGALKQDCTIDGAWHDLDLTTIGMETGVRHVQLKLYIKNANDTTERTLSVRPNGKTPTNPPGVTVNDNNEIGTTHVILECGEDENKHSDHTVEYMVTAGAADADIFVIASFLDEEPKPEA